MNTEKQETNHVALPACEGGERNTLDHHIPNVNSVAKGVGINSTGEQAVAPAIFPL